MADFTAGWHLTRIVAALLSAILAGADVVASAAVHQVQASASNRAQLVLRLANGAKMSGRVVDVRSDAITLEGVRSERGVVAILPGNRAEIDPRTVFGVAILPAEADVPASAVPIVRRVIGNLGVGARIDAKTSTRQFRGTIQSVDQDSFTAAHGLQRNSEQVSYRDLRLVQRAGMPRPVKWAIIGGLSLAALLAIGYATSAE